MIPKSMQNDQQMKMLFTMEHDNEDNTTLHLGQYLWLAGSGHPTNCGWTTLVDLELEHSVPPGDTLYPVDLAVSPNPGFFPEPDSEGEKRLTKPHDDLII